MINKLVLNIWSFAEKLILGSMGQKVSWYSESSILEVMQMS